ncbi:methyltransferase domain-containing protein [Candidatus Uabimicrobium sp. HlEnr_7]|uniref:methyltransferase domain-containing protein n=1 Tax=Candidatus Uabimicrobium helgolandensis TaxID=3095367 RepID=UPI003558F69E
MKHVTIDYLDYLNEVTVTIKKRSYELMKIVEKGRVLDVGCGPATDTIALAKLVGKFGQVVGIDNNEKMIQEAEIRKNREQKLAPVITHKKCCAYQIPYENNYFDSCRSERVLQHLSTPEKAISEMVRVTKKGGHIVVIDTDFATTSVDTTEKELERSLINCYLDYGPQNADIGRQLYRLFKQQNIEFSIEIHPYMFSNYQVLYKTFLQSFYKIAVEKKVLTEKQIAKFAKNLKESCQKDMLFASVSQLVITGHIK